MGQAKVRLDEMTWGEAKAYLKELVEQL